MQPLSTAVCQNILSLLTSGHSVCQFSKATSASVMSISRVHQKYLPELPKASGRHLFKLSPMNIHHAIHLITSKKASNAVQVRKALAGITDHTLKTQTVRSELKKARVKVVVNKKELLLTKCCHE